jgi:predicted nucleic acid-binding protein
VKTYYDASIILKLYTEEPQSDAARAFVTSRGEALYLSRLHTAECTSALRLKQFRDECEPGQVAQALAHLEEDFATGVLKVLPVDWDAAWQRCRIISDFHAAATGCRTLDALHVACAVLGTAAEFITSDRRQFALGQLAGLRVINPFEQRKRPRPR